MSIFAGCGGLGGNSGTGNVGSGFPSQPQPVVSSQAPDVTPHPDVIPVNKVSLSDNTYMVYKSSNTSSQPEENKESSEETTDLGRLIVLAANVPPPSGYISYGNANIIMIDTYGTPVEIPLESDGTFKLDRIVTGEKEIVDIYVVDPVSGDNVHTQLLPLDINQGQLDQISVSGENIANNVSEPNNIMQEPNTPPIIPSPVSQNVNTNQRNIQLLNIKIVPGIISVLSGDTVFYRVIGIDTNGMRLKPSSVKWSPNVTPVQGDSSMAIFSSSSAEDKVEIIAWIPDPNNPDEPEAALMKDVSIVTVIDRAGLTTLTGTLYDTDGITPMANSILFFDSSSPGVDYIPFRRISKTDVTGKYTVSLKSKFSNYISVNNLSDKKKYQCDPDRIIEVTPDGTSTQNIIRKNQLYLSSSVKIFPPVERYIRYAWCIVDNINNSLPALFLDMHPIINDEDEPAEGEIMEGRFRNGYYSLTRHSSKWDMVLINQYKHNKATIVYEGTKYKGDLMFSPFDINDENNKDICKIRKVEWDISDKTYTGTMNNYSCRHQESPFEILDFTWLINDDKSIDQTMVVWSSDKVRKLGDFFVRRSNSEEQNGNILYSYTGDMDIYLYEANDIAITKTLRWELKEGTVNQDLSGKFNIIDNTDDSLYKGTYVVIDILPVKGNITDSPVAIGSIYRKEDRENSPYATFKIYSTGLVSITDTVKDNTLFSL